MYTHFLKSFFAGLSACLWVALYSACSDSAGEACTGVCADPAYHCEPIFNVSRLTGSGYSDCEETIVARINKLQECNDICLGETIYNEKEIHLSFFDYNHWYCDLSAKGKKNEMCSLKYVGENFNALERAVGYCDMDRIVVDGAIKHFVCEDGDTVSVKEGLRRKDVLNGSSTN